MSSIDNYYIQVDGSWKETQDEADFTEYWVDVQEPCSDFRRIKHNIFKKPDHLIGFLDCRYFFDSHDEALEFFINNGREALCDCRMCSNGKVIASYDKKHGYKGMEAS